MHNELFTLENKNMKTLILGSQGTGKTMFIVKKIIPTLNNYQILDYCDEYSRLLENPERIIKFEQGLVGRELYANVRKEILNTKDDIYHILDNADLLIKPLNKSELESSWLMDFAQKKNIIIVCQTIQQVLDRGLEKFFDEIYCFPTKDSDEVIGKFFFDVDVKVKVTVLNKESLKW